MSLSFKNNINVCVKASCKERIDGFLLGFFLLSWVLFVLFILIGTTICHTVRKLLWVFARMSSYKYQNVKVSLDILSIDWMSYRMICELCRLHKSLQSIWCVFRRECYDNNKNATTSIVHDDSIQSNDDIFHNKTSHFITAHRKSTIYNEKKSWNESKQQQNFALQRIDANRKSIKRFD